MSRIASFANKSANDALMIARVEYRKALNDALEWLARYESDKQCDDDDRQIIATRKAEVLAALKAIER